MRKCRTEKSGHITWKLYVLPTSVCYSGERLITKQEQFNKRLSTEIPVHCGISLYQRPLYQKLWRIINISHSM